MINSIKSPNCILQQKDSHSYQFEIPILRFEERKKVLLLVSLNSGEKNEYINLMNGNKNKQKTFYIFDLVQVIANKFNSFYDKTKFKFNKLLTEPLEIGIMQSNQIEKIFYSQNVLHCYFRNLLSELLFYLAKNLIIPKK